MASNARNASRLMAASPLVWMSAVIIASDIIQNI
jgi:hypothetical protein